MGIRVYVKRLKIREEMYKVWAGLWLAAGGADFDDTVREEGIRRLRRQVQMGLLQKIWR